MALRFEQSDPWKRLLDFISKNDMMYAIEKNKRI